VPEHVLENTRAPRRVPVPPATTVGHWTVLMPEEADPLVSPPVWTALDEQPWVPLPGEDPGDPQDHDIAVIATRDDTLLRLRWRDAAGIVSRPSAARRFGGPDDSPETSNGRPSTRQVAKLIPRFTRSDETGAELLDFSESTDPTRATIEELIDHALGELFDELDIETIPDRFADQAQRLVAVRVASLVLLDLDERDEPGLRRFDAQYLEGKRRLLSLLNQQQRTFLA
jgi:hypothetical protein